MRSNETPPDLRETEQQVISLYKAHRAQRKARLEFSKQRMVDELLAFVVSVAAFFVVRWSFGFEVAVGALFGCCYAKLHTASNRTRVVSVGLPRLDKNEDELDE